MKSTLTLLLPLALSCGEDTNNHRTPQLVGTQDEELRNLALKFEAVCNVSTQHIDMKLTFDFTLQARQVGQCIRWEDGRRLIEIDYNYWWHVDTNTRHWLVYHELGHCALELGHDDTVDADGNPRSLMYPYVQPKLNAEEYLKKLCN